jgi:hypothetical protein
VWFGLGRRSHSYQLVKPLIIDRPMSYYPEDAGLTISSSLPPSLALPPFPLLPGTVQGSIMLYLVLLTKVETLSVYRFLAETTCLSLLPSTLHPPSTTRRRKKSGTYLTHPSPFAVHSFQTLHPAYPYPVPTVCTSTYYIHLGPRRKPVDRQFAP